MASVNVACKLPNGLVIEVKGVKTVLKGANTSELVNGFGVTEVDSVLWAEWLKIHGKHPAVVNGLVFAQGNEANVKAQTKDHAALETGLEGIDPDNPGKKAKISPEKIAPADAA